MKDINLLINSGVNVNGSLELLGDMDTYNDILSDFLNGYDERIGKIKAYKEAGEMPRYAIEVHALKSDSKYLGFTKLAELAYNHEMQSKANDVNYVNENYDSLIAEAERIHNLAKEYLGEGQNTEVQVSTGQKAILIADDSEIIRNIVTKMLGNEYRVIEATNGNEAVTKMSENLNDVVGLLLDLNMPEVDGFAVLSYMKENNLFLNIPVVIITGDDSKDTIMKAFEYPIVDVLNKPFNESDVQRVIMAMNVRK